jgi:hypothetical protein
VGLEVCPYAKSNQQKKVRIISYPNRLLFLSVGAAELEGSLAGKVLLTTNPILTHNSIFTKKLL